MRQEVLGWVDGASFYFLCPLIRTKLRVETLYFAIFFYLHFFMYMIFVLLGIFFSAFISDEDDYKVSFGYFM